MKVKESSTGTPVQVKVKKSPHKSQLKQQKLQEKQSTTPAIVNGNGVTSENAASPLAENSQRKRSRSKSHKAVVSSKPEAPVLTPPKVSKPEVTVETPSSPGTKKRRRRSRGRTADPEKADSTLKAAGQNGTLSDSAEITQPAPSENVSSPTHQKKSKRSRSKSKRKSTSVEESSTVDEVEDLEADSVVKVDSSDKTSVELLKPKAKKSVSKPEVAKETTSNGVSKNEQETTLPSPVEVSSEPTVENKKVKGVKKRKKKTRPVSDEDGMSSKEPESVLAKYGVGNDQILSGVNAFLKYVELDAKNGEKPKLFEETVIPVYLTISAIRIPKGEGKNIRFKLPHKPIADDAEVCLIIKDKERGLKVDHEDNVEEFKSKLEENGASGIVSEVISLRQLKVEYKQFEAKRKLAKRFDAFFVDQSIYFRIHYFLGKHFFGTEKRPIPIQLDKSASLKDALEKGLRSSMLAASGKDTTMQLLVGNTSMSPSDLAENVSSVFQSLNKKFPGNFENIRSVYIRTAEKLSIPLYISLLLRDAVPPPVFESKIKQNMIVGDVSTLPPGQAVVIEPDGTVRVICKPNYKPTVLDEDIFFPESDESDEPESDEDEDERPKKKVKKSKNQKRQKEDNQIDEESEEPVGEEATSKKVAAKHENLDESDSEVDLEEERYLKNMMHMQGDVNEEDEKEENEKTNEKLPKVAKKKASKPSKKVSKAAKTKK